MSTANFVSFSAIHGFIRIGFSFLFVWIKRKLLTESFLLRCYLNDSNQGIKDVLENIEDVAVIL